MFFEDQLELLGKILFFPGYCEWCPRLCLCVVQFSDHLCFGHQQLKRVEVIEDDESQIVESVRRMSDQYDFVVTR